MSTQFNISIMSVYTYAYIHVSILCVILGPMMLFRRYWFDPRIVYPWVDRRRPCDSWREHLNEYTYSSCGHNGRKVENNLGW